MDKFLSRQQMEVIKQQAPKGSDGGKIIQALIDKGYKIEGLNDTPTPNSGGNYVTNTIGDAVKSGVNQAKEGYNQAKNATNPLQLLEGGAKLGAGVINTAMSPLAPVTAPVGKAVDAVANKVSDNPAVQKFANSKTSEILTRATEDISNLNTIVGAVAGVKGGEKVAGNIPKATEAISNKVKQLTTKSEAQIESAVLDKFQKGVKPRINSKMTLAGAEKYKTDVVSAVKTIKQNAPNLSFVDDVGEVITGQTPKSLQQLSDSIEQTKKTIFNQYDSLAKEAGKAGVGVEMTPIAKELDSVINNKALGITNPKAVEYAKSTQERLNRAGRLDATTAQEVIQNYNKSLEAFYRNPSYDTASNAAIDALLANRVREALDEGISGLTGKEYSSLKKQYGSLKTIEKDVVKATLRDARKNVKGLIDFTDILSGGQVVNGILSLNPATIAQGVVAKGISEFYKYLNNPNRAIEKMFNVADKLP